MIELYRKSNCRYCNEIEEELKELVVSHKIINIGKDRDFQVEIPLPAIKDDNRMIFGYEEIQKYIADLKKFGELWRKYQADAYYIDDDGEI